MLLSDFNEEVDRIKEFIQNNLSGKSAVVGVSGGIDSALVLKLLSLSIPRERILAFHLPPGPEGDPDIPLIEENTGVNIKTISISKPVDAFISVLPEGGLRVKGNLMSRIRMCILYYHANLVDGLVIGTTNRSEYLTGYFTKYGDGACDIEPILHLYKTEVRSMARFLGLPERIINKVPSAGLWEGQTDEEEMGMKYEELDRNLIAAEKRADLKAVDERIASLIRSSVHKRITPRSPNRSVR